MQVSSILMKAKQTTPLPSISVTLKVQILKPSSLLLKKIEGVATVSLSAHGHTPHYVPMDDELVSTLLRVYEKQTGLKGHEQVIGGGTFGRLLKRGVAFGAMFPDYVNTMHQANEFADVEDLYRAAAIYAEAIYELIK